MSIINNRKISARLYFPAHIPALAAAVYIIYSNWFEWSRLPVSMAVHFDGSGRANGWMSREMNLALMLGILALFIVINTFVGMAWAKPMLRGRFNFFAVVYAVVSTIVAWSNHCLLKTNLSGSPVFTPEIGFAASILSAALFFSVILEWSRVRTVRESEPVMEFDPSGSKPQSSLRLKNSARFYLEQRSKPWWWNPVMILALIVPESVIWIGLHAADAAGQQAPAVIRYVMPPVAIFVALVVTAFVGGFRYSAKPEGVTIKLGLIGVPLKRIDMDSITGVTFIKEFSPLSVFLGYGWRINPSSRLTGYCLCTGEAVKIQTKDWGYILVMEKASDFAAVLEQALQTTPIQAGASHP